MEDVTDAGIDAAHIVGVTLLDVGPGHFRRGWVVVMVPDGFCVIWKHVAIDGTDCGVEHCMGFAGPLDATVEATTRRVGAWRILQFRVRRVVGQVDEERLGGFCLGLVCDPLFRLCGPEVGGVALVEIGSDFAVILPDFAPVFFRVMEVAVLMADVAEKVVEPSLCGKGVPRLVGGGLLNSWRVNGGAFVLRVLPSRRLAGPICRLPRWRNQLAGGLCLGCVNLRALCRIRCRERWRGPESDLRAAMRARGRRPELRCSAA